MSVKYTRGGGGGGRRERKRLDFESFRARKADRNLAVETRVLSTDAEAIPLVKFIYLVFTRILGERNRRRFGS